MYYVMSVPEWLILIFILSLWIISILFCIKRFEKISTIQRMNFNSDLNKLKMNNETTSTNLYQTASNSNINNFKTSATFNNLNNNFIGSKYSIDDNDNSYLKRKKHSTFTSELCKASNFQNNRFSCDVEPALHTYNELSALNLSAHKKINVINASEILHLHKASSMPILLNVNQPNFKNKKLSRHLNINNSGFFQKSSTCSSSINIQPLLMSNSTSDVKAKKNARDNSITIPLINKNNSNNNYLTRNLDSKKPSLPVNIIQSTSDGRKHDSQHIVKSRGLSNIRETDLFDPNKISKFVQKSFIDLHKKSMLNLSQNNNTGSTFSNRQRHSVNPILKTKIKEEFI